MAESFTLERNSGKREEDSKNTMNATLINKILGNNKKKKTLPLKRPCKVLLPPCIVYISNSKGTVLKVPPAFSFDRCFAKPKLLTTRICHCGTIAKYRMPKTLAPYCSLLCSKSLPKP